MSRPDVEGCGREGEEVAIARGGEESVNGVRSAWECVCFGPACGEIAHDLERLGEGERERVEWGMDVRGV